MSNRAGNGAVILGQDYTIRLTPTERHMLKLLAGGHSPHEALQLIVSDALRARVATLLGTAWSGFMVAASHGRWA